MPEGPSLNDLAQDKRASSRPTASRVVGWLLVGLVMFVSGIRFSELLWLTFSTIGTRVPHVRFTTRTAAPRIAFWSHWVNDHPEEDSNIAFFVPTFLASACQNADVADLYFVVITPGPRRDFKRTLCDNVFVAHFNHTVFLENLVIPLSKPYKDAVQFRSQYKNTWIGGWCRPMFPSLVRSMGVDIDSYSHWGWSEPDMVWGKLSDFLTPSMLREYDVISARELVSLYPREAFLFLSGQLTVLRNIPFLSELWRPWLLGHPIHGEEFSEESSFSDAVLSNAINHTRAINHTFESTFSSSRSMAAWRKHCGLHTMQNKDDAHELSVNESSLLFANATTTHNLPCCGLRPHQELLRVHWVRSGANMLTHTGFTWNKSIYSAWDEFTWENDRGSSSWKPRPCSSLMLAYDEAVKNTDATDLNGNAVQYQRRHELQGMYTSGPEGYTSWIPLPYRWKMGFKSFEKLMTEGASKGYTDSFALLPGDFEIFNGRFYELYPSRSVMQLFAEDSPTYQNFKDDAVLQARLAPFFNMTLDNFCIAPAMYLHMKNQKYGMKANESVTEPLEPASWDGNEPSFELTFNKSVAQGWQTLPKIEGFGPFFIKF